ncbi:MAG: lytic transglycosylase F [Candidatus Scalindua sp. AMX11]|nr:MAG: lytic transglycosylase F [Candidatus Scalindua sp.]NOG84258.1 lytic transglycosylase F [Planctomycetota bacterium]RZV68291.1 MAG: lytic transglycosylase F [Candidatus Scalindua sp. SCAELEC01]TDE63762.1 MAG: lytic transglycosylase F [Candidatus Scalindua sp. AMX11]GJQ60719.1 MAG: peptidoglycan lytic exotransglycosylase [Candidatus Scalindua sp.]
MKITERHVKIFSAVLFAIAIALFVYQSFIDTSGHPTSNQKRLLGREESSSLVGTEPGDKQFNSSPEKQLDTELINEKFKGDLDQMKQRKIIRALVVYSKTDFFFVKGGMKGIQVELLHEYEKFLNRGVMSAEKRVRIIYIPVTFDNLLPALNSGKGDIAADFLTITPEREKQVCFISNRKMPVTELVVSHKSVIGLNTIEDLAGRAVYILKGSSYIEHLGELNTYFKNNNLSVMKIEESDFRLAEEDILELVNSGTIPITVVDDYRARLWSGLFPNLQVNERLKVVEGNYTGWAVRKENQQLEKSLNAFVQKVGKGSLLGNILFKRYYTDVRWIKNPLSTRELRKLEQLITLFKKYGEQYNIDYLALLAQAYQESSLDHSKKSPRGAIGIMQLLPSTASDPHINIHRIDLLENNIHAGTKYLSFIRDRYYSDPAISREDRLAFSWAAYNAGPAKVRRMRAEAKRMGLNRDKWFSHVEVSAGKIVGRETVQYVSNIYKYYIAYKLSSNRKNVKPR